jgi:hypothetical protein
VSIAQARVATGRGGHHCALRAWIDWSHNMDGTEPDADEWREHWARCVSEASEADVVLVYAAADERQNGALVEMGAALASGAQVYLVTDNDWSTKHHPAVRCFKTLADAVQAIVAATKGEAMRAGTTRAQTKDCRRMSIANVTEGRILCERTMQRRAQRRTLRYYCIRLPCLICKIWYLISRTVSEDDASRQRRCTRLLATAGAAMSITRGYSPVSLFLDLFDCASHASEG